ncbi:MAG: hypothetical protein WKF90_01905 [Pyrinomonadaceae bacterium]
MLILLLIFLLPSAAQETCQVELKDAPTFFNLRLGMTAPEVQNIIGKKLKVKVKKKGERTFFQNFIKQPPPNTLSGVRALYLRFFNGALYQIEIFYEEKTVWKTVASTEVFSAKLNLAQSFQENTMKRIESKCIGFSLMADNVLNPRIELTNEMIRAQVLELRRREEENRKK